MPTTFDESKKGELRIIQRGSTHRVLFFFSMGVIVQLLLVLGYWHFIETMGFWAFFWLGVLSSEFFPIFQTIFLFGGGCFLISVHEAGWRELWIIKKDLHPDSAGIRQIKTLFKWSRMKTISKDQIKMINLHIIPLDKLKLINRYQIEIKYRLSADGPLENEILYKDVNGSAKSEVFHLTKRIQEILDIRVQKTEAAPPIKT